MSFKFNYCRDCGAAAQDEWMGSYSPETGEKIMRSVCSKVRCHTDHDRKAQPLFSKGDWKCSRCGEIGYWYCGL